MAEEVKSKYDVVPDWDEEKLRKVAKENLEEAQVESRREKVRFLGLFILVLCEAYCLLSSDRTGGGGPTGIGHCGCAKRLL